jgi:hypothetical protein
MRRLRQQLRILRTHIEHPTTGTRTRVCEAAESSAPVAQKRLPVSRRSWHAQEVQRIFSDLNRKHALGSLTKGNDVTDVVLKYIPVGTSFDAAEGILRSAGCRIDIHPADIPKPHRPLRPQEPVLATLVLGGWPMGHYLSVALVPKENGDYGTVTSVSAAILMAYS